MNDRDGFDPDEEGLEIVELDQEQNHRLERNNGDKRDDGEEDPPMQPIKLILIFAGLVALAALICGVLWFFTHRGDSQGGGSETEGLGGFPSVSSPILPEDSPQPAGGEEDMDSGFSGENDTGVLPEDSLQPVEQEENTDDDSSPEQDAETLPDPSPETEENPPLDGDVSMTFEAVEQSVTPKDVVNLRTVPSTADADTVEAQASNGEVLTRTGINADTGWSRIEYNGQILYAVTQYLTTDLTYKTPVTPADPNRVVTAGGRVILFSNCDDQLTPKEYVNLRTEPSTSGGDATVSCQVKNGETVHRTGVSADSGWSRVEYNGQILYVVTSLMQTVQNAQ